MSTTQRFLTILIVFLMAFGGVTLNASADDVTASTRPVQQITGKVTNGGKPVTGVAVRVVYSERFGRAKGVKKTSPAKDPVLAETTTDKDGNFTFTDIDPGNYIVIAAVRKQQERGREMINVKAGQQLTVQIELQSRGAKAPATQPISPKKNKKSQAV